MDRSSIKTLLLAGALTTTVGSCALCNAAYDLYQLTEDPGAKSRITDSMECTLNYQLQRNMSFEDDPLRKAETLAPVLGHLVDHEIADNVERLPFAEELTARMDEASQEWCKKTVLSVMNGGVEVAGK